MNKRFGYKVCHKCKEEKPISEFHKNYLTRDRLHNMCKECTIAQGKIYRDRNRLDVIQHYGGKCECCGEDTLEFLAIDHINNDGAEHRRKIGNMSIYLWIIQNKYPDGFRVLCHNCNSSRGYYGYCPHQNIGGTHGTQSIN